MLEVLDYSVTEEILQAAFISFGDLKYIQIPRDYTANKHKGFGFVEFENEEDAADAVENMNGAELFGKVIHCSVAKAVPQLTAGKAVWNNDDWMQAHQGDEAGEEDIIPQNLTLIPEKRMDDDE